MKEEQQKDNEIIMKETKKQIIKNSIISTLIILCFIGVYVTYSIIQDQIFTRIWQAITMMLLGIAIVIFEVAYKKDSGKIAINGIETLMLACYTLTLEYIRTRFGIDLKIYTIVLCGMFVVYFILKMLIIYTAGRKKELNSLSDIADIVKEDEPKKKKAVKHIKGVDAKND